MKKDFTKEDALITKWKALLPQWEVTHRPSRKRKLLIMIAQILDNQEKYMKNLPQGFIIPPARPLYEWMIDEFSRKGIFGQNIK